MSTIEHATDTLDTRLVLGGRGLGSRLIVGTGKYEDYEVMQRALDASGAEVITVAVRREPTATTRFRVEAAMPTMN